jgi:rhamnosyltransferase
MTDVDAAGHDFVALADQDDLWEPGKLARAARCLRERDGQGYSAAVRAFWPDGRTAILTQNTAQTPADYLFEGMGQGCTFVLRASFFVHVQRTLEAQRSLLSRLHYHDWTLYALCRVEGGRWIHDDWVSMRYRQHAANDTGARSGLAGIRMRLEKIRDGWYGRQVDTVARLCVAVTADAAGPAQVYLQLGEAAAVRLTGRISLCWFVWKNGRRRATDRLVVAWAALNGHLSQGRLAAASK